MILLAVAIAAGAWYFLRRRLHRSRIAGRRFRR
jgi:hypothetical protein